MIKEIAIETPIPIPKALELINDLDGAIIVVFYKILSFVSPKSGLVTFPSFDIVVILGEDWLVFTITRGSTFAVL